MGLLRSTGPPKRSPRDPPRRAASDPKRSQKVLWLENWAPLVPKRVLEEVAQGPPLRGPQRVPRTRGRRRRRRRQGGGTASQNGSPAPPPKKSPKRGHLGPKTDQKGAVAREWGLFGPETGSGRGPPKGALFRLGVEFPNTPKGGQNGSPVRVLQHISLGHRAEKHLKKVPQKGLFLGF